MSAEKSVYRHLVTAKNDFVGMIAYSLYEETVSEIMQNWPDPDERKKQLDALATIIKTETQRDMYRTNAAEIASEFLDEAQLAHIEEEVHQKSEEMRQRLKREWETKSFLRDVFVGIMAWVGSLFVVLIAVAIGHALKYDPFAYVESLFQHVNTVAPSASTVGTTTYNWTATNSPPQTPQPH